MILLNTAFDSAGDETTARYFIAQHMPDLLRRESRNIGVFVEKEGQIAAKFVGENLDTGTFDGRALRGMASPKAFRVWVRHWRKAVEKDGWQAFDRILDEGAPDFTIIPGGEVTETGGDSPSAICDFLYGTLVSTGGLAEALAPESASEIIAELKNEVVSDLRTHGLMAGSPAAGVRNPVYDHRDVKGARYWHPVSLYQETRSVAWAIEPINFVTSKKGPACDRAGSLAHMFGDIRALDPSKGRRIETIALVRARPEDAQDRLVERALSMLSDTCTIVPWLIDAERKRFITDRERAAFDA